MTSEREPRNVDVIADVDAYLDGVRKAKAAIEKEQRRKQRREWAWAIVGVIGAAGLVTFIVWSAIIGITQPAW